MRRTALVVLVSLIVGASLHALWDAPAAEATKTDAFRNQFLKDFKHIPLDSTAGDAMLLRILVEASGAKRGVEVGSARGFGAMNMGMAFERTGGHLTTLEISPEMATACRANLKTLGLEKVVTCVEGDALKTLPKLEGEIDFVFIDAVKSDYFKYFKAIEKKLTVGAIVVADNSIRSARAMQDFLDFMDKSPDWDAVTIRASMEKRDGMTVCYKIR